MPAALGVLGMVLVSRSSDRTGERVWHVTLCTLAAGIGLVLAGVFSGDRTAALNPTASLILLDRPLTPLTAARTTRQCLRQSPREADTQRCD